MRHNQLPDWCEKGVQRDYCMVVDREWHIGWKNSGHLIIVKKGFEFESSVPRGLRWFMSPHDPAFLWPAALHDFILEKIPGVRRPFADSQWIDAARSENAPKRKREYGYLAMRIRMFFKKAHRGD